MKPNWTLTALSYGIRQLWLSSKLRIRQWGHLPPDRGATVLITNHQHMDEGETVTARTFFRDPWKPLVMCNSRRTFETGFIAARLPWSVRFTRGVNLSGLWSLFSILPIENHLFSRPLISLAEELREAFGDVPLDEVLPADTLQTLGLTGCRLSDLWKLEHFMDAQAWIKVARLRQPYRRKVVENLRATAQRDVEAIVERVRGGATFYVTPEGDFSHDGRMHPMRGGIVDALAPFADLWLCAIAYDPFRRGRLNMLYRVLRLPDGADVGASLAAARPVTVSALLATFLLGRAAPFSVSEAEDAVRAQLASLPEAAFVDPELRARPDAIVAGALAALTAQGTLAREGELFRLTERRHDARFAHVPDMVLFQRNVLAETLECVRGKNDGPADEAEPCASLR